MPWTTRLARLLKARYPGILGLRRWPIVLFGDVNPSGKLPLTFARTESRPAAQAC